MKKIALLLSLLCITGMTACKKDEKKEKESEKYTLLTTGKWQLSSLTYQNFENGVADPETDSYIDKKDCEKDNYVLFSIEKNIISDEGPTKCYADDIQRATYGSWAFIDNETKLRQSDFYETIDWDIEQLDAGVLKISNSIKEGTRVQKSTSVYKNIK